MTAEQDALLDNQNPLEFLKGRNFVVAETFIMGTDSSSNKTLGDDVYHSLSRQGIADRPLLFIFCNSQEEQVREIITVLKGQEFARGNDDSWMGIVGFNADQLQKMFETISLMIIEKDPILEGIDGENITVLQLNAPSNSTITDKRTGLKIAAIKKGEPAYPTHPTPNS